MPESTKGTALSSMVDSFLRERDRLLCRVSLISDVDSSK